MPLDADPGCEVLEVLVGRRRKAGVVDLRDHYFEALVYDNTPTHRRSPVQGVLWVFERTKGSEAR